MGGANPPLSAKHGRRSEHVYLLAPFWICAAVCFAMCWLYEITVFCSMLTLPRGANIGICKARSQILEFVRLVRSFPRSLDAVIYDLHNLSCSANIRNLSRTANIVITFFLAFSKAQNAVIDRIRSISRTANVIICISPSLSKAPNAAFCSIRNLPKAATQDQRTKRLGDQRTRTRGPEDQGTRGPEDQSHT